METNETQRNRELELLKMLLELADAQAVHDICRFAQGRIASQHSYK